MMMTNNDLVIGTRGSKLALWQAEWVKELLVARYPGISVKLNIIKTTGDRIVDVPLAQVGGKGLFVKEIEEALQTGHIDIAVHSMKDVPTELPEGLHLPVILKREDPRDAFITPIIDGAFCVGSLQDLPLHSTVGTSSLRRACQLRHRRSDLNIIQLRGNLDTRLRKLDEQLFDAIIVASAGVKRLGWQDRITEILPPEISMPAIGQGAVGIECRRDDIRINELIAPLNHSDTATAVRAERALLRRLEGGCQVPIAGYATIENNLLTLRGLVGSIDGKTMIHDAMTGEASDAETIGMMLAEKLLQKGADEILRTIYGSVPKGYK
jgi:hydroxymethylbilane synthase